MKNEGEAKRNEVEERGRQGRGGDLRLSSSLLFCALLLFRIPVIVIICVSLFSSVQPQ
jgi:hypothetical protein